MKVLFITDHGMMGAGTRSRILSFLPYLRREGIQATVRPFFSDRLHSVLHGKGSHLTRACLAAIATAKRVFDVLSARRFDVVFVHREAFPFGPPLLEWVLAKWGGPLVVDFDDALYSMYPYSNQTTTPSLYKLKRTGTHFGQLLAMSDQVIAGNRILAAYAKSFNANVSIIPTVVDTNRYGPKQRSVVSSPVVVGWMGSHSTIPYVCLISEVLCELQQLHKHKVRFVICGDAEFQPICPNMIVKPFDLEAEVTELQSYDIGIMPLDDNEWTRGKCAYKALLYMGVGIPAVSSDVGIVSDIIDHGNNGFIARSHSEWIQILSRLIDDMDKRLSVGAEARCFIEDHYSVEKWAPLLVEVLENAFRRCE